MIVQKITKPTYHRSVIFFVVFCWYNIMQTSIRHKMRIAFVSHSWFSTYLLSFPKPILFSNRKIMARTSKFKITMCWYVMVLFGAMRTKGSVTNICTALRKITTRIVFITYSRKEASNA